LPTPLQAEAPGEEEEEDDSGDDENDGDWDGAALVTQSWSTSGECGRSQQVEQRVSQPIQHVYGAERRYHVPRRRHSATQFGGGVEPGKPRPEPRGDDGSIASGGAGAGGGGGGGGGLAADFVSQRWQRRDGDAHCVHQKQRQRGVPSGVQECGQQLRQAGVAARKALVQACHPAADSAAAGYSARNAASRSRSGSPSTTNAITGASAGGGQATPRDCCNYQ
ncbi:hypothetical protein HK405_015501, partial [Cladochytrium tenue]